MQSFVLLIAYMKEKIVRELILRDMTDKIQKFFNNPILLKLKIV